MAQIATSVGQTGHESIAQMQGLGQAMERRLAKAGITCAQALRDAGAVQAYLLAINAGMPANLNALYALAGAIENRAWLDVARTSKGALLLELDAVQDAIKQGHVSL